MSDPKPKAAWSAQLFERGHLPDVARLMREVYGEDHRSGNEAFLDWQYFQNPLGPAVGFLALAGSEVVGAYTLIPSPFSQAGESKLGMLSLNTATSPRFQGQGIFTVLARRSYEEAERRGAVGVLGFPNENSLPGFVKKLGFALVGRMAAFALPRKVGTLLARDRPRRPREVLLDAVNTAAISPLARLLGRGVEPGPIDQRLPLGAARSPAFALAPDEPYLHWRYAKCPLWSYEVLHAPDGAASVVCRHGELWGVRTTLLLDFAAHFGDRGSERALARAIRGACRRAVEEDSAMVLTLVSPHHPAIGALWRSGLVRVPDRFLPHPGHVIFRPLGAARPPGDFGAWAVAVGAYDAG